MFHFIFKSSPSILVEMKKRTLPYENEKLLDVETHLKKMCNDLFFPNRSFDSLSFDQSIHNIYTSFP
jgi:hypothetical protein